MTYVIVICLLHHNKLLSIDNHLKRFNTNAKQFLVAFFSDRKFIYD